MNGSTSSHVTRRQFVGTLAAAATATFAAPYIRAEDKSGLAPVIVGKEGCQFEVVRGWGKKLPEGIAFGTTHGVGIDKQGRVFIHNTGKDATMIFDPDGVFIKSWGEAFAGGAHGFDIIEENGEEFAYMSDTRRRVVVKTTLDGEVVVTFPTPPVYSDINQYCPTNISPLPNGDILVGDGYGSSYIHQFTKNGDHVKTWGGKGSEAGRVNSPHGLWLDTRGDKPVVIVCDRGNNRLQLFDTEGNSIKFVTNGMRMPCHIDIRGKETLVPDLRGVVTLLDDQYNLITHLGDNPESLKEADWGPNYNPSKLVPGKFVTPHDACFDKDGNIYVTEWLGYGRVTKLKRIG